MRTKEEWMKVLSYNIRRITKARDITADDIAKLSGIHPATLSQIKNSADLNPTLSTLVGLANALNMSVPELFKEPDETKPDYVLPKENRYLTFSHWFWDKFFEAVGRTGTALLDDEVNLRHRFESFLDAVRPDAPFTNEEKEAVWNDRHLFLGSRYGEHIR
jgi:transcriptional regulator with XRE-family HTH domain